MKMKKITEKPLSPVQHWEKKLNFNFEIEFIRYKKLYTILTKKEIRKIEKTYSYSTYSQWEKKTKELISKMDPSELYEYIHFLKGCAKNKSILNRLTSGLLLPFLVSYMLPYIFNLLDAIFDPSRGMLIFITFSSFLAGCWVFYYFITDTKNDLLRHSFYVDLLHIVKKYYKNEQKPEHT